MDFAVTSSTTSQSVSAGQTYPSGGPRVHTAMAPIVANDA
jgi:hypothetical protein